MELITGYKGEGHVTSTQFRDIMRSIVGEGSYIADLGEKLVTELVSNNSIKIRSGMLLHHGGVFEVPEGTYDEVTIANGTQGTKRIDLIVARYTKNSGTGVESGEWVVIQGTPAASNPAVPAHTEGNMQDGDLVDDCPMYEVELDGINVTETRTLVPVMPNVGKISVYSSDKVVTIGKTLTEINDTDTGVALTKGVETNIGSTRAVVDNDYYTTTTGSDASITIKKSGLYAVSTHVFMNLDASNSQGNNALHVYKDNEMIDNVCIYSYGLYASRLKTSGIFYLPAGVKLTAKVKPSPALVGTSTFKGGDLTVIKID